MQRSTNQQPDVLATATVENPENMQQNRSPSPTPTEVDDPEPESIIEQLTALNIKVRDFAYPTTITYTEPPPPPTTEIFDQYRGIAEFEFRLAQNPRTRPIEGKTLKRLLALRWVSMAEAKQRLHQMDWEAMKDYEALDAQHPWRPCKWSVVPDAAHRAQLVLEHGAIFIHLDKIYRMVQAQREAEEQEQRLIREAQERLRVMEAEREGGMGMVVSAADEDEDEDEEERELQEVEGAVQPDADSVAAGKKRALEHTASTPSFPNSDTLTGPKRARLSDVPDLPASFAATLASSQSASTSSSQPSSSQASASTSSSARPIIRTPPPRQYPAPLSSYDPELYPEAARVIEAEARPPTPRADTPPLDDDDDGTDTDSEERPGNRLTRPRKGLKRAISRTQTFRQL
ncbi:hypothetical protein H0H81_001808 [Sphagnurus paluster]|uniref:Uncharacterized protein n=1 Tax=Sphagnurus paluster TaxID=117069 RepID=A0A9P7GFX3_9AGAR|nr:hypothetical protein H0H81_001808 [Sphagnurus paluster]